MATDDDSDVPETGGVFTFGKSKFADNSPSKFWVRNDEVVEVACGDEHTALVTRSGRIFTFGANDWGQLGLGDTKTRTKPSCIKSLKSEKILSVACGRTSTYIATEKGGLYSFGGNTENQLGQGVDDASVPKPASIACDELEGRQIKMLTAGADHAAVLTSNGLVYIWGGNSSGQLGLGDAEEVKVPTLLEMDEDVTCISCGYYHTALTTESGDLYMFGESDDGKLGLGEDPLKTSVPHKVQGIKEKIVWVACGGSHTIAISSSGKAYSFGDGSNGQLGHGNIQLQATEPQEILALRESRIRTAACGENHTALISEKGVLFTFGDGRHGKLALGEENFANQFKPSPCTRFGAFTVEKVACGGCHMLVLAKPKLQNGVSQGSGSDKEASEESDHHDHGKPTMLAALRKSDDLSLSGSFSARNRRREKQESQSGNSLTRTLPPLSSSFAGGRSLPPLGSSLSALQENSLNKSMLPPVRKPAGTRRKKTRFTRRYENGYDKKDEDSDKRESGESPEEHRKVGIKGKFEEKAPSHNEIRSLPVPLPRGNHRVPSPRMVRPIREERQSESEEDSEEPKGKPVTASRMSEAKSSPVPRPRLDRRRLQQKEESEEESEDTDASHEEYVPNNMPLVADPGDKPPVRKKPQDSEDSDEEEEKSRSKSSKGKEKKKKLSGRKRGGPFGRKKLLDSDEEEEEGEEDEVSNEDDDDSSDARKDKKKKYKDSEEDSEEDADRKKKKAKEKSKHKSTTEDEDEEEKGKSDEEDKSESEEKKSPDKEKKSKLCIIL